MDIRGKRFLVTGGAGFIGSHLVDELLKEDVKEVIIFDNLFRGRRENVQKACMDSRVRFVEINNDITNYDNIFEAVKNIDGVFHLASLCLAYCQEHPRRCYEANVIGTLNLLEACVKNDVKRIIFSSSSSVYGNAVYSPMDEEHPFKNRNFYGASKISGEALFKSFYYKYRLPYLALRYMNVYGPRQDFQGAYVAVIIKIIDRIQKGKQPIIHGDGTQSFDFVYVVDACRANIKAMKSEIYDRAYNISSGKQVSILNICNLIKELMGSDANINFVPVEDDTLVINRIGSTKKALKDLGFNVYTPIREGLALTIQWKLGQKII